MYIMDLSHFSPDENPGFRLTNRRDRPTIVFVEISANRLIKEGKPWTQGVVTAHPQAEVAA